MWRGKQRKTESHRSKMPHGTHEQLCSIIFERVLRPILRIPMTNFMDFVWVVFFFPLEVKASFNEVCHKLQYTRSAVWAILTTIQDREKLYHGALPRRMAAFQQERATLSPPPLSAGPSLPSSDGVYGSPRPSYHLKGLHKCQGLGSYAFISIFFLTGIWFSTLVQYWLSSSQTIFPFKCLPHP